MLGEIEVSSLRPDCDMFQLRRTAHVRSAKATAVLHMSARHGFAKVNRQVILGSMKAFQEEK